MTRIVLLEDEPAVRRALQQYLGLEGYEVLSFGSVRELEAALVTFESAPHLLITDFHLRGDQVGTDAIDLFQRRFGAAPAAIVLSGDTAAIPARTLQRYSARVLSKPINGRTLSAAVQELLATSPTTALPPTARS